MEKKLNEKQIEHLKTITHFCFIPISDENLMTVQKYNSLKKAYTLPDNFFKEYADVAYWADGWFRSEDSVFNTPQLNATHIAYYNKTDKKYEQE